MSEESREQQSQLRPVAVLASVVLVGQVGAQHHAFQASVSTDDQILPNATRLFQDTPFFHELHLKQDSCKCMVFVDAHLLPLGNYTLQLM